MPSLRALVAAGHEIELVVTQPDRPANRLQVVAPAVKLAAQELELELFQPERIRSPEAMSRIAESAPELLVVAAYGQIVPSSVLEIPSRGPLNVHGSLLPRWRGAAPVASAIREGDQVTGVTIMLMDEALDHGPLLSRRELPIGSREDAVQLTARLAQLGAELLVDTIARLDEIEPVPQDHGGATYAGKLSRADGELDWSLPADVLDRHVRAYRPWPGVTVPFAGGRVKILSGRPLPGSGDGGAVLRTGRDGVEVACAEGAYLLEAVQLPGRKPMPARQLVAARA